MLSDERIKKIDDLISKNLNEDAAPSKVRPYARDKPPFETNFAA